MAGDNLAEMLEIARLELQEVPPEVWAQLETIIRKNYGTQSIYIAAHRKRNLLKQLDELSDIDDTKLLSEKLGVSVRRIQQLKSLK